MLIKYMSLPPFLFAPFWIGQFLGWMCIVCQGERIGRVQKAAGRFNLPGFFLFFQRVRTGTVNRKIALRSELLDGRTDLVTMTA